MSQIKSCPDEINFQDGVTNFFAQLATLMLPRALSKILDSQKPDEVCIIRLSVLSAMPQQLDAHRNSLYPLMREASHVICEAKFRPSTAEQADSLMTRQANILKRLEEWLANMLKFQAESQQCPQYQWAASLLLMYYSVSYIWLSACISTLETAFDGYIDMFGLIVLYGKTALAYAQSFPVNPVFAFELGLMQPLFFTSVKCRHPRIRRAAARLMREASGLKSIWNPSTASLVDAVVAIEEFGNGMSDWEQQGRLDLASFVPEQKRVHQFHLSGVQQESSNTETGNMVASLLIHPCETKLNSCVRKVLVQYDVGNTMILEDETVHGSCCCVLPHL